MRTEIWFIIQDIKINSTLIHPLKSDRENHQKQNQDYPY